MEALTEFGQMRARELRCSWPPICLILPCFFPILRFNSYRAHSAFLSACLRGCCQAGTHSLSFSYVQRTVRYNNLRMHKRILHTARWLRLALSTQTIALAA